MWTDTRVHTFRHFRVSTSPSLRVLRPWEYMEEIDADMGINNVKNPRRGDVSGVYMYSPAGRRDKTHTLLLVLFSVTFCIFFPIFVHVYLYTCLNPNTEFEVLHTEHKRHIVFPRLSLQPQCTFTPPAFFFIFLDFSFFTPFPRSTFLLLPRSPLRTTICLPLSRSLSLSQSHSLLSSLNNSLQWKI